MGRRRFQKSCPTPPGVICLRSRGSSCKRIPSRIGQGWNGSSAHPVAVAPSRQAGNQMESAISLRVNFVVHGGRRKCFWDVFPAIASL